MPAPTHTPASRRFLPTSSSSYSHVNPSPSTYKRPFATPSLPSSSPFVKTPYRQEQKKQEDDIEVGSDYDEDESSPLPDRAGAVKSRLAHDDTIEEVAEDDSILSSNTREPGDALTEEVHMTYTTDSPNRSDQFSSPLPKRQKRNHLSGYEHYDDQDGISSPSTDKHTGHLDQRADLFDVENDDVLSSADEAHMSKSRFQSSTPANIQFSQTSARTGFRSLFQNMSNAESSHLISPLPDIFSPSRKKGKRDYLHDGAAETTRSWILEIANEHSRDVSGPEKILNLVSSTKDESGRFEMAEDEHRNAWMMVYSDGRAPGHVVQQKTVRIRGNKTSWQLELDKNKELNVAVLWDRK